MDTTDAQVSLGSDGIIESHPNHTNVEESTTKTRSPTINSKYLWVAMELLNLILIIQMSKNQQQKLDHQRSIKHP